jgi:hypothetical protein
MALMTMREEILSWLRRRRERKQRIEARARILLKELGSEDNRTIRIRTRRLNVLGLADDGGASRMPPPRAPDSPTEPAGGYRIDTDPVTPGKAETRAVSARSA